MKTSTGGDNNLAGHRQRVKKVPKVARELSQRNIPFVQVSGWVLLLFRDFLFRCPLVKSAGNVLFEQLKGLGFPRSGGLLDEEF